MASLPAQFADASLAQQLQTARTLSERHAHEPRALHSGIAELDACFAQVRPGDLVEWGIPPGFKFEELVR